MSVPPRQPLLFDDVEIDRHGEISCRMRKPDQPGAPRLDQALGRLRSAQDRRAFWPSFDDRLIVCDKARAEGDDLQRER